MGSVSQVLSSIAFVLFALLSPLSILYFSSTPSAFLFTLYSTPTPPCNHHQPYQEQNFRVNLPFFQTQQKPPDLAIFPVHQSTFTIQYLTVPYLYCTVTVLSLPCALPFPSFLSLSFLLSFSSSPLRLLWFLSGPVLLYALDLPFFFFSFFFTSSLYLPPSYPSLSFSFCLSILSLFEHLSFFLPSYPWLSLLHFSLYSPVYLSSSPSLLPSLQSHIKKSIGKKN